MATGQNTPDILRKQVRNEESRVGKLSKTTFNEICQTAVRDWLSRGSFHFRYINKEDDLKPSLNKEAKQERYWNRIETGSRIWSVTQL